MENKKTEEKETKEVIDKPVEPVKESLSIVDEAKKVRDEIKGENDRREEILKKEQKLRSEELLGGTGGGRVAPSPEETEDEKWAKDAKIRYEGTGMDPTPTKAE